MLNHHNSYTDTILKNNFKIQNNITRQFILLFQFYLDMRSTHNYNKFL